jgi:hypothetical protein
MRQILRLAVSRIPGLVVRLTPGLVVSQIPWLAVRQVPRQKMSRKPTHQLKTHLPAHLLRPGSLSSSRLRRLSHLAAHPLLSFRLYLRLLRINTGKLR